MTNRRYTGQTAHPLQKLTEHVSARPTPPQPLKEIACDAAKNKNSVKCEVRKKKNEQVPSQLQFRRLGEVHNKGDRKDTEE